MLAKIIASEREIKPNLINPSWMAEPVRVPPAIGIISPPAPQIAERRTVIQFIYVPYTSAQKVELKRVWLSLTLGQMVPTRIKNIPFMTPSR